MNCHLLLSINSFLFRKKTYEEKIKNLKKRDGYFATTKRRYISEVNRLCNQNTNEFKSFKKNDCVYKSKQIIIKILCFRLKEMEKQVAR